MTTGDDAWVDGAPPSGGGLKVAELDISPLCPRARQSLYRALCAAVAVPVTTRPFSVMGFGMRRALVASGTWVEAMADALGATMEVVGAPSSLEMEGERLVMATVAVRDREGRVETATATVRWSPLGDAGRRVVVRAWRRGVLSLLGLAVLDDHDVAEIRGEAVYRPGSCIQGGAMSHPMVR